MASAQLPLASDCVPDRRAGRWPLIHAIADHRRWDPQPDGRHQYLRFNGLVDRTLRQFAAARNDSLVPRDRKRNK